MKMTHETNGFRKNMLDDITRLRAEKDNLKKELAALAKENGRLKIQNEAYDIQLNDVQKDCESWMGLYAFKSRQHDELDQEFEETIRGEILNFKGIERLLGKVECPDGLIDDNLRLAMNRVSECISNLEKFTEERWGHGEED